jgi:lysophospholipase L1-like esterase
MGVLKRIWALTVVLLLCVSQVYAGTPKSESGQRVVKPETLYSKDGKWIFIGDSYGAKGSPLLPELIAGCLGVTDYKSYCRGGYGVARKESGQDKRFISMIQSVAKDKAVKNVMIIGGISNDKKCSKEDIRSNMSKLARTIRVKYPNCAVYYIIPNWHANWTDSGTRIKSTRLYQRRILTRLPWYKEMCGENGFIFLDKVSNSLRRSNNSNCFISDGHHPNVLGKQRIASAVASCFEA